MNIYIYTMYILFMLYIQNEYIYIRIRGYYEYDKLNILYLSIFIYKSTSNTSYTVHTYFIFI